MLIVLISLLTLALLIALVLGLHRYQLSVAQSNADKHDPLPPLDSTALNSTLPDLELDEDLDEATPFQSKAASETALEQSDSSSFSRSTMDAREQPHPAFQGQVNDEEGDDLSARPDRQGTETGTGQSRANHENPHDRQTASQGSSQETTRIEVPEPGNMEDQPTGEDDDEITLISSPGFRSSPAALVAPPVEDETPDSSPSHRPLQGSPEHQAYELPADSTDNNFATKTRSQKAEWAAASVTPSSASVQTEETAAPAPLGLRQENAATDLPGEQVEALSSRLLQGADKQTQNLDTQNSEDYAAGAAEPGPALSDVDNWQEQVQELKKQDRLDDALKLCQEQLPLWSAYQQASLIHRARLKLLSQEGRDIEGELKELYDIAAKASFLHDRVKGLPNLPLSQLKRVDLDEVESLEMPYEQIGYNELRLIKKTDIKLLLEKWGKPQAHIKPRELHAETWKSLIARRQTTLF
ncbi:MAG: hypothetical protein R3F50_17690 [Gammaproteobacteria bacterium]